MCCLRKGTMRPWIDCCVQWELFVQVWSSLFGPSPWHGIVGGSFEWWEPISSTSYWPSGPNSLGWNARSRGHFRNSEGIYGRRPTQWAYRVIGENCHWQLSVQRPQVQNNLILRVHMYFGTSKLPPPKKKNEFLGSGIYCAVILFIMITASRYLNSFAH